MAARTLAAPLEWMLAADDGAVAGTEPPERGKAEVTGPRGCVIYTVERLYEAQLLLDLLAESGIAARLFNEHLIGAMGELPFSETLPKIWLVDETEKPGAQAVISAYEERRRRRCDATRRCGACGEDSPDNFELCWSCREPFDLD